MAQPPSALPAPLVGAWTRAGAEVGWTRWHGFVEFSPGIESQKAEGAGYLLPEWEVPAFRFRTWTDGVVATLPQPDQPFGLSLYWTNVTDAGLKELGGMERLRDLDVRDTAVTEAGLAELQRALPRVQIRR